MPLIDSFTHLSIMVNAIVNRSPNGYGLLELPVEPEKRLLFQRIDRGS